MVYRRKFRVRRRRTRKIRRNRRRTSFVRKIPRGVGIPKQMLVKFKVTSLTAATIATSGLLDNEYHLNSLYNPNVGVQPYYFDQLTPLYQRYRVYGCKVTIRISYTPSAANHFRPYLAIIPHYGSTSYSTVYTASNVKGAISSLIDDHKTYVFKKYYPISTYAGYTKSGMRAEDSFSADVGSNPASLVKLNLMMQNEDGTNSLSVVYSIQMVFYAKLYEIKFPATS